MRFGRLCAKTILGLFPIATLTSPEMLLDMDVQWGKQVFVYDITRPHLFDIDSPGGLL